MSADGSGGLVAMIVGGGVLFCGLIGGLVWMYSAQSAKQRKSFVAGKGSARSNDGN
jgi:hypothetical protein